MIFNLNPSNAYRRIQSKIPNSLSNYELVVIHYNTEEFFCDRWTTRSRDIMKKKAKMLQVDMCSAYLMEPSRYIQFEKSLQDNMLNKKSFMFLAYRFFKDKWVSYVDIFSFDDICQVEHFPLTSRR